MSALPEIDAFDQDQWPRRCTRVAELAPGHLRLDVVLRAGEAVCDVFVEERSDSVGVEVLACPGPAPSSESSDAGTQEVDIYLETALNGRAVIDLSRGAAVAHRPS